MCPRLLMTGIIMEKILIGKITSAVGLKGEVKVYNYSDSTEIYENTPQIYVGEELMGVRSVRTQKNMVVLGLDGICDRDAAEKARGRELFVTEDDLPELPEGQFYVRDLIGMEDGRKVLIPKVDSYVLEIDGQSRRITVHLQEGILDL